MFDTLLTNSGSRMRRMYKGMTFSLSLILHAAAIIAVIVVPLLRGESELPEFSIIDTALIAPPILPGPPPGPGRPGKDPMASAVPANGPKNPPPVSGSRALMAPIEIPTEIIDEDPTALDLIVEETSGGVDGGVGDGKIPWLISKDILPEEVKPIETAITTIRPPRLIKRVNPSYSPAALAARISGPVVIEAVTDIYGRVREARIVSGHPLLSPAALEAVKGWIYEPYLINGIPRPVIFTVTVTFTLEKR